MDWKTGLPDTRPKSTGPAIISMASYLRRRAYVSQTIAKGDSVSYLEAFSFVLATYRTRKNDIDDYSD